MKRIIMILLCIAIAGMMPVFAQSFSSGTTVIIGFEAYDNNGLYGQLISEADGIITISFYDDGTICRIDNKGNIIEGADYINQKRPGRSIQFIQIYENKKQIRNPDYDIDKTTGNFIVVVTATENTVFGVSEYRKTEKEFLITVKPDYTKVLIKYIDHQWQVSQSSEVKVSTGSIMSAVYLYNNNSRRFYTHL